VIQQHMQQQRLAMQQQRLAMQQAHTGTRRFDLEASTAVAGGHMCHLANSGGGSCFIVSLHNSAHCLFVVLVCRTLLTLRLVQQWQEAVATT
jgi:hypothetical protein